MSKLSKPVLSFFECKHKHLTAKSEKVINMKKLLCMAIFIAFVLSAGAIIASANQHGGFTGPSTKGHGGFTGPGPKAVTIKEATNQPDDTWVTLKGYIVQHDGDDIYTLKDPSGTGKVEIERKAWHGQNIGPNDMVELITKVDKDWGHVELEVKQVRKVQ